MQSDAGQDVGIASILLLCVCSGDCPGLLLSPWLPGLVALKLAALGVRDGLGIYRPSADPFPGKVLCSTTCSWAQVGASA